MEASTGMRVYQDGRAAAAGVAVSVLGGLLLGPVGMASHDPVAPPAAILAGGETTVDVADADGEDGGDGNGDREREGGPNAELALGAALSCDVADWTLAAVDTDGHDGSTAHAGAIVDAGTVADGADERAARGALSASDSYGYLRDRRGPIDTGSTGTNVNDLVVVLVD